jgi:hypothetical protein
MAHATLPQTWRLDEMRNWIRRWLDIEVIVTHIISNMKRLDTHSRHIEALQIEVQELQRNLELALKKMRGY